MALIVGSIIPEHILALMSEEQRREFGRGGITFDEACLKCAARNEKKLQAQIANLLLRNGICFYRARMDKKTTGTVGWPDFTFAINGHACAWEIKMPGETPTAEQDETLSKLLNNGWRVRIVCSYHAALTTLHEWKNELSPT